MLTETQKTRLVERELAFITSRSGGKGGQNVNKVESKVELIFDLAASVVLTEFQKTILFKTHSNKLIDGCIRIKSEKDRSQLKNKSIAVQKLLDLLDLWLKPKKKRVATKPGLKAKERKRKAKKLIKDKKLRRKKPIPHD